MSPVGRTCLELASARNRQRQWQRCRGQFWGHKTNTKRTRTTTATKKLSAKLSSLQLKHNNNSKEAQAKASFHLITIKLSHRCVWAALLFLLLLLFLSPLWTAREEGECKESTKSTHRIHTIHTQIEGRLGLHSLFLVKFCAVFATAVVVVVVVTIFICGLWPSGLSRFLAKSLVGVSLLPATFVSLCTHAHTEEQSHTLRTLSVAPTIRLYLLIAHNLYNSQITIIITANITHTHTHEE